MAEEGEKEGKVGGGRKCMMPEEEGKKRKV